MTDPTPLFADDFTAYPPGRIPNSYSPWGEYHCRTDQGRLGPWAEATCHYSWRSGGGCWRIITEGERRVMEQQFWTEHSYPLLVAGETSWRQYSVQADVRLLSFAAPAGIVAGYRHSRDFVALLVEGGCVRLVHRRHGREDELGTAPLTATPDAYHRLVLHCHASHLEAALDGRNVIRAHFDFPGGPIGLLAGAPTRFTDVRVLPLESDALPEPSETRVHGSSFSSYPRPKLWRRIDTHGFGTDRNIRVGDLNNDGRNELLLAQPRSYLGSDDFCTLACLTAVDLEGNVLWQRGTPTHEQHETTTDLCFQVYDLDGDGRTEIIYTSDLNIHVADGCTGETLHCIPTPGSTPGKKAAGAWPLARILGDCLYFADLRGTGRKDTLILKNRYTHAWVYDSALDLLWDHECTTGHYPAAYDVDGDGRDELMLGYTLLDGDGNVRWTLDTFDHADSIVVGRMGPPGSPVQIALAASDAGFYLLDAYGAVLRHHEIGHAQMVSVLKLRPDVPGLQIVVNTYWGEPGITLILDWQGAVLQEFEPMHYAGLLLPVNWTNDDAELVLLSGHPGEGGLIDGFGRRVVMFPDDGHPTLCCDSKDLDGDGVDEIMVWDYDSLWVYKPDPLPEKPPLPYPLRNDFFNESNYRGQFSFPASS